MNHLISDFERARAAVAVGLLVVLGACGGGQNAAIADVVADASTAPDKSRGGSGPPKNPSTTFATNGLSFSGVACAREGGECVFSGEKAVAYGANGKYIVKSLTDKARCNNATFGDPIIYVVKSCFLVAAMVTGGSSAGVQPTASPVSLPVSPPVNLSAKPTRAEAARFLIQATYGPNLAEIDRLAGLGYSAWLDEQFSTPPMDSHWNYVRRMGPIGCNPCTSGDINGVMESFWMQAVRGPDQLRQRTVFALSEIFVVSAVNSGLEILATAHAGYLDMLSANAFGNFRTLIEQAATHPSMGVYLSHMKNEKEDAATGRLPDENFARELMQLFTVGLWELNEDGSRKKDSNGNDISTYSQADIMGMAKVFTGWSWGTGDWEDGFSGGNPRDPYEKAFNRPMISYAAHHSAAEKRILRGTMIPANTGGAQSLKIALDTLFNHPNVGPFIGSQLIKRMVTSNPSPAYVKRVSQVFNNSGNGVRGDMKAVISAVLLDPEARDSNKLADPTWGKLREPMIRYANFMRAFNLKSSGGYYKIWNLEDTLSSVGQNPVRAPSVFNWFRPDYAPPGALTAQGLVAPEFQITHETTTTGYANFMANVAERQNTWFRDNVMRQYGPVDDYLAADYSAEMALAANPNALLDRLNLLLMAGQMTAATRATILEAVSAVPADAAAGQRRVAFAIYLVMQSPEFIVQK